MAHPAVDQPLTDDFLILAENSVLGYSDFGQTQTVNGEPS